MHVVDGVIGDVERLVSHGLGQELHVEAEKVDELTSGVDLGLIDGLALTEHGRS